MKDFIHDTTAYSPVNACWLGQAALLAYENETRVAAGVKAWGMKKCAFISERETQCFVAADNKKIILAFRGTEPNKLRDWMSDARVVQVSGPFGKVHKGFDRALRAVWPRVQDTIVQFRDRAQSLWITGHSLGGALALLAMAYLRDEDRPVYGLYTFGEPRVGNRTFERNFNQDCRALCFRFVNNNDVVTRVPLRAMNYSHVGTCLYFDSRGKIHYDLSRWLRFLDSVEGSIRDLGKLGPDALKDHAMTTYARLLKKNEGRNPFD